MRAHPYTRHSADGQGLGGFHSKGKSCMMLLHSRMGRNDQGRVDYHELPSSHPRSRSNLHFLQLSSIFSLLIGVCNLATVVQERSEELFFAKKGTSNYSTEKSKEYIENEAQKAKLKAKIGVLLCIRSHPWALFLHLELRWKAISWTTNVGPPLITSKGTSVQGSCRLASS